MISNIDCAYIFIHLDMHNHDFILNQQKVVVLEELKKYIWTTLHWWK